MLYSYISKTLPAEISEKNVMPFCCNIVTFMIALNLVHSFMTRVYCIKILGMMLRVIQYLVYHARIKIAHNGPPAVENCGKPHRTEVLLKGGLDHTEGVCNLQILYLGHSG